MSWVRLYIIVLSLCLSESFFLPHKSTCTSLKNGSYRCVGHRNYIFRSYEGEQKLGHHIREDMIAGRKIISRLHLFGMFGDDKKKDDPDYELIRFSSLEKVSSSRNDDTNRTYGGMKEFIREWSLFLTGEEQQKEFGLTTPVKISVFEDASSLLLKNENNIESCFGVKMLFQNKNTGYKSKNEEKEKKKEENTKSEGGVLLMVESTTENEVRVIARRCDIEEGTMIKEMSEETIVGKLKEAMAAWKKEQSLKIKA